MRLIDADALKSTMLNTPVKAVDGVDFDAEWFTRIANTAVQFTDMVEDAPTVDAVPVVRCGECKWWDRNDIPFDETERHHCLNCDGYWYKDEFCSDGERKETDLKGENHG